MRSPSNNMVKAYELGKRLQGRCLSAWAYGQYEDAPAWDWGDDSVIGLFFDAGLAGAEMPRWGKGWRYGDAPASGRSYNHRDGRHEAGVSMMEVDGDETEWDASSFLFFNSGRPRVEVEGWLSHRRGADGEPLLVLP
jgi:hypothetical protein